VASISALAALLLDDDGMRHGGMQRYGATLTQIADAVLGRSLAERHDGSFPFAVLALGKYGSAELIPGSDLDVILLFTADEHAEHEQAQCLARDLIADLRGGVIPPLYEVDARLRPEGRNAPLAVTFDSWRRYLDERASLWERQSLLRARIAAGDPALGARIMSVIDEQRHTRILTREDIAAVRTMRLKMEPENRFRQTDFIDIKKSAGGLIDAEFAAQLLQLAFPALPAGATTDILVSAKDQLPGIAAAAAQLREQYVFLRRLQLFLRLLADTPSNLFPHHADTRRRLASAMQAGSASALLESLRAGMAEARRNFGIILDAVSSTISS
jgi:glutamate-ammonia-ligase adenylyltransferase